MLTVVIRVERDGALVCEDRCVLGNIRHTFHPPLVEASGRTFLGFDLVVEEAPWEAPRG